MNEIIKLIVNFILSFFNQSKRSNSDSVLSKAKPHILKPKTDFEKMKYLILDNGGNWKDGKPFLFGLRDDRKPGIFNDPIGILHYHSETKKGMIFKCSGTTDPGLPWIKNPINSQAGCAIVCLGVYNDVWILGDRPSFRKYVKPKPKSFFVFRQNGSKIRIRLDANKNGKIDSNEPVKEGNFEIQFHPMGFDNNPKRKIIGNWSAGCQGPQMINDYYYIRSLALLYNNRTKKNHRYSYALFNIDNLKIPKSLRSL